MNAKKTVFCWLVASVLVLANIAVARPHGYYGPRPYYGPSYHHYHHCDVIAPFAVGLGVGLIGAAVVAPSPVVVAPAPVIVAQPQTVVVQQPAPVVVQQPAPVVVQQAPVVEERPAAVTQTGKWVEREERKWIEGCWVEGKDQEGRLTRTWKEGYYEVRTVREWVP